MIPQQSTALSTLYFQHNPSDGKSRSRDLQEFRSNSLRSADLRVKTGSSGCCFRSVQVRQAHQRNALTIMKSKFDESRQSLGLGARDSQNVWDAVMNGDTVVRVGDIMRLHQGLIQMRPPVSFSPPPAQMGRDSVMSSRADHARSPSAINRSSSVASTACPKPLEEEETVSVTFHSSPSRQESPLMNALEKEYPAEKLKEKFSPHEAAAFRGNLQDLVGHAESMHPVPALKTIQSAAKHIYMNSKLPADTALYLQLTGGTQKNFYEQMSPAGREFLATGH